MNIFTARENFKTELIEGHRNCKSCKASLHGKTALVVRWKNKKRSNNSLAICDDECWSNYDHNYWLERAAGRMLKWGHEPEAIELLEHRLPIKGERANVS